MKYISKCHNQTLTIKPNRTQVIDGIAITVPGEHVRFYRNEFETEDKKIIEFLGKHKLKGTAFVQAQTEAELEVAK